MRTIVISEGQSLVDICVQEFGSVQSLVKLCASNNLSLDANLTAGQVLRIDESNIVRPQLVSYLKRNATKINTGGPNLLTDAGVGEMAIGTTLLIR